MLKKFLLHPTSSAFIQLFRYAIVVGIAFPIDFGLLYVFTEFLHMHYLLSTILAFTISMLVNFAISILWVFKARTDRPLWKEITAFFIIGFVGLGLTAAIVWFCTSILGTHYLVSKLIAVSLVFFWSFGARRLMFMKHTSEYLDSVKAFFKKHPFLTSPAFVMFLVSVILFCVNLAIIYKLRPFNSDDVFWQAILFHWKPFEDSMVTLGNSSIYVDKIPFYHFLGIFTEPGRKELFFQAAIPAVLGFAGFYWASVYFLKRVVKKLTFASLIPFAWIATLGYSFASLYLNPNWRGFQIGFSFALFALVAALWSGRIKLTSVWSKILLVVLVIFAGLQLHSDPYFLYFTLAPLGAFTLAMYFFKKINRRHLFITLGSVAATFVVSKVFALVTAAAGIQSAMNYPMQFISFDKLNENAESTAQSILTIFNADISNLPINSSVVGPLLNFLIVLVIGYGIYLLIKNARQYKTIKKLPNEIIWLLFFVAILTFVAAVYAFSTMNIGVATYRYLLLFALLCVPVAAYLISQIKSKALLIVIVGLFAAAIVANTFITLRTYKSDTSGASNVANVDNTRAIDLLKEAGYTKGYANYWDANISTYLSGGEVVFLPSVCPGDELQAWHWLINDDAFKEKANKSFYIYNPYAYPCQDEDLSTQFGQPTRILNSGPWKIYLYDYDITSKMEDFVVKV